jgi:hypothetical protein
MRRGSVRSAMMNRAISGYRERTGNTIKRCSKCLIPAAGILVFSFVTESESASNDLESKATALNILSKTATDLCKDIPIYGEGTDVELTGEAKAEIDNLIKKVIDLKVGGAARYISDDYKGVLRKDLAIVLKNSTDCKVEVLKLFHDDFFPPREDSAIKPPSKPASGLPGPTPEAPTATTRHQAPTTTPNVLYETGIGKGEFDGWLLTPGWKRHNGMLLNDGTRGNKEFFPSMAPYKPLSADYAVETEIRVIQESDKYGDSFGVVVRANDREGYAVGVASKKRGTRICYLSAWVGVGYV